MAIVKYALGLVATFVMAVQPCAAADDLHTRNVSERRTSAFAGVNARLPLGQTVPAKPTVRLQLTTVHSVRDATTGSVQTVKPQGLEIGAGKLGKASFYLNGRPTADMQKQLGVAGTGTTLLLVGGVLIAVVVLAFVAGGGTGDTCPLIDGSRDHCINR